MANSIEVSAVAQVCHEANRGLCEAIGDTSQVSWNDAEEWQRQSAVAGVRAYLDNPGITSAQMHENWCEYKIADGWVYGEVKDAEKKTHPCLVPYADLPEVQQYKDKVFCAIVGALLPINQNATILPPEKPITTDPIPGLTEGRVVHYILPDGPSAGQIRPAMVVRVWNRNSIDKTSRGCVQLQVFTDGPNDALMNVEWRTSVLFDDSPTPAPGTWNWPARA
ncbi:hypothetical protein CCAX7_54950 [Capsulimonas corticalis]|uniref:Uncharacterized protein n=1 Tax=Capsulimonas corticalis TaxID=2219043 RepID=A0A402D5M6_9BACT|nr:RyR domain-containing protein [Capsulimonas corticalis]BDI33444.1 hypothetical protein CCAX7_54950 [Capsulimonas corticalis]